MLITLRACLVAAVTGALALASSAEREAFVFLEMNDIHISDEASMRYPLAVVDAMNRENAAFTLVCGDLATDGKVDELDRAKVVLDRLKSPYFVVAGNHDAEFAGDRPETRFRSTFGLESASYRVVRNGVHFVAIDPGIGSDYEHNAVRPDVMKWLTATAAALPDGAPVILFSHYPYGPGVTYRTENADEVLRIFSTKRLLAVISGHFHGNTERVVNNVLFTTTATSSSTRENHDGTTARGYRVFRVGSDLTIRTEFREFQLKRGRA